MHHVINQAVLIFQVSCIEAVFEFHVAKMLENQHELAVILFDCILVDK
jgi:hypothetical protein